MVNFPEWLAKELNIRGMSPSDLARASKKAPAVISRILNGERNPAPETIVAIAQALRLPPEDVFKAAVGLPQNPKIDLVGERANNLVQTLKKPSSKQRALDYLQLLIEQEEREERENAAKKNHPATQPR